MFHTLRTSSRAAVVALGLSAALVAPALVAPALADPVIGTGMFAEPIANAAVFAPLIAPISPYVSGPMSGSTTLINQIGESNFASANISGNRNFSAIDQSGSNNRAVQAIEGTGSAQLLMQAGNDNSVVQATQGSNNFQLVGVSGRNNEIAYVQSGNQLAGALDVRDSTNSSVLALQTNASSRYLMPTGLRGLDNKVVVIVPGRMYVFPK